LVTKTVNKKKPVRYWSRRSLDPDQDPFRLARLDPDPVPTHWTRPRIKNIDVNSRSSYLAVEHVQPVVRHLRHSLVTGFKAVS